MQQFFTVASRREVMSFGAGCLPSEIYAEILKYSDIETHRKCARVSRTFEKLCNAQFPGSRCLNVIGLKPDVERSRAPHRGQFNWPT